jgi:hypothetical protein
VKEVGVLLPEAPQWPNSSSGGCANYVPGDVRWLQNGRLQNRRLHRQKRPIEVGYPHLKMKLRYDAFTLFKPIREIGTHKHFNRTHLPIRHSELMSLVSSRLNYYIGCYYSHLYFCFVTYLSSFVSKIIYFLEFFPADMLYLKT